MKRLGTFIIVMTILMGQESSALAAPSRAPVIVTHDIGDMMDSLGIKDSIDNLRGFTVDAAGKEYGFVFDEGSYARYYNNGTLVYSGKGDSCSWEAYIFMMTDDGHLVYSPDCTSLYVDDEVILEDSETLAYSVRNFVYENGALTYIDGDSVYRYDIASKKRTALHRLPGKSIQYIQKGGKNVYFSAKDDQGSYFLYKNGKKLMPQEIGNPTNFLVTKKGEVYSFINNEDNYEIFRDKKRYFLGEGQGAFLFVDDKNTVWHVSARYDVLHRLSGVSLHKGLDAKNLYPADVRNVEGSMVFEKGVYAQRVLVQDDVNESFSFLKNPGALPNGFSLMKNGKIIGDSFAFASPYKDYHGLFLAKGKVYMRNFDGSRWQAYEDGKVILQDAFDQVWLVTKQKNGTVAVYGS